MTTSTKSPLADRSIRVSRLVRIAVVLLAGAFAQAAIAQTESSAVGGGKPRVLAPGVMVTIPPAATPDETVSRHDVVEILADDAKLSELRESLAETRPEVVKDATLDFARNVAFRREIWCLEFRFKPVRLAWVDLPQDDGKLEKRLIWYMVYSVTNPGEALRPVEESGVDYEVGQLDTIRHTYTTQPAETPIRFIPHFILAAEEFEKSYPDRVIPAAMGVIATREDPNRTFYNSQSISEQEIAPGETVWGIATWEFVDPRVDRFSIYVAGLTNAYQWIDEPDAYSPGDPVAAGRRMLRKILKLNFWRPGDEYYENEKEIRYGVPGEVDYEWLYR